ncbi:MAG: secretin and TonB N-terminal domain-containing protein [Proteobacteria bacterium]|nr:secretin and TonB N-terminal domain-containing protein [Pseudomonadota bacterium]
MKKDAKGLTLIILLLFLTSCASMAPDKKNEVKWDEWKDKAEKSQGYSPSVKKKSYAFNRNMKQYKVENLKALPKKRISLKMSDADVAVVLRSLALLVDVNVLISEKVTGKINVAVEDVPWDEVFDNILKTHGLSYVNDKHLIRIMTDEDLVSELNREKLKQSLVKMEPIETRIVKVDFSDSKALKESLMAFLDQSAKEGAGEKSAFETESSTIAVDTHTNSLVIRATRSEMARILPVIQRLDKPTRQILILANIVETNQATARELGARWGSEGGDFTAGMDLGVTGGGFLGYASTHGRSTLSLQLSALQSDGKLKILSSPSITTIDNKKAMIESGKEIPYQSIENGEISVAYKKAVIHLEVTPHVIDNMMVKLEITTSKDEIDNSVEVNGNPGIITKKAETQVVLFNGNTTMIGGLNKDRAENNKKGIPWLMNLPVIGHLFKWISDSNEMEELLIFITPRILEERMTDTVPSEEGDSEEGDSL